MQDARGQRGDVQRGSELRDFAGFSAGDVPLQLMAISIVGQA
jgi:hypothetical protein